MNVAEQFETLRGCFEVDLCIEESFYGGIYAKKMMLPEGYFAISHKHNYDHMSILAQGKCMVVTDAGSSTYEAPAMISIPKGLHHEVIALKDVVWFCIHATEEIDHIDDVLIERGES